MGSVRRREDDGKRSGRDREEVMEELLLRGSILIAVTHPHITCVAAARTRSPQVAWESGRTAKIAKERGGAAMTVRTMTTIANNCAPSWMKHLTINAISERLGSIRLSMAGLMNCGR